VTNVRPAHVNSAISGQPFVCPPVRCSRGVK
jgi:hypothetical protein